MPVKVNNQPDYHHHSFCGRGAYLSPTRCVSFADEVRIFRRRGAYRSSSRCVSFAVEVRIVRRQGAYRSPSRCETFAVEVRIDDTALLVQEGTALKAFYSESRNPNKLTLW